VSKLKITTEEEIIVKWSEDEKESLPRKYGCEIILQDITLKDAKDSSYPTDAYIIFYDNNGKHCIDLCRGSKVKIFDLYYDKFGPGVVKKIDFGYGRLNPKLWGYRTSPKKKKR
jgi:hypothetical protein